MKDFPKFEDVQPGDWFLTTDGKALCVLYKFLINDFSNVCRVWSKNDEVTHFMWSTYTHEPKEGLKRSKYLGRGEKKRWHFPWTCPYHKPNIEDVMHLPWEDIFGKQPGKKIKRSKND